jgi:recombination protein RecA
MPKAKQATRAESLHTLRTGHSEAARAKGAPLVTSAASNKKFAALNVSLSKKYKGEVFATIANGKRSANISVIKSGWSELDDLVTGETDAECRTIVGTGLGWPRGRIIEIYGDEGMGKTTLALHVIAAFQRAGERCGFVDAEHALDVRYASKLGVDLTTLILQQPDRGGEQTLDIVDSMAGSGAFGCIVVDSVAALTPLAELELDLEDSAQPGGHARLMSRALRKLAAVVAANDVLLVFINQTRMKIGVRFGNPKTTTGGNALKFYSSIRIEMVNVKTKKKGDRVIYRRTRIRTVKNKVASPFRDVYADIAPGKGIVTVHGEPKFEDDGDDSKDD